MVEKLCNFEISRTPEVAANPGVYPPVPAMEKKLTTGIKFQTNNAKLYAPVVTLPINDNIIFLEIKTKALKEHFL